MLHVCSSTLSFAVLVLIKYLLSKVIKALSSNFVNVISAPGASIMDLKQSTNHFEVYSEELCGHFKQKGKCETPNQILTRIFTQNIYLEHGSKSFVQKIISIWP